jgi:hypothetical protein
MSIRAGIALLHQGHGREIVVKLCRARGLRVSALNELVDAELAQAGKERKRGLYEQFDAILSQFVD